MKKITAIRKLLGALVFGLMFYFTALLHAAPISIEPDSAVITPIQPEQLRVLVEQQKVLSLQEASNASDQFIESTAVGPIQSTKAYWLMFQLRNNAPNDRDYRLNQKTFGLLNFNVYLIHENGDQIEFTRNYAMLAPGNRIAEVSPFITHNPPVESQYLILRLHRNEVATVFARIQPDQRFLPKQFNFLSIVDHAKYLELRRYGLYLEGALTGALLALAIFGWYSYFRNRDHTSLTYGIWILFALGSVLVLGVHDGSRMAEFFVRLDDFGVTPSGLTVRQTVFYFLPAGQSITYVIFARSFLNTRERFKLFHYFSTAWIAAYFLQFSINVFTPHTIPPSILWNPLLIWLVLVLLGIYGCAFVRLQEGMKIARFFMIAMVPYVLFRSLFLLGVVGLPSPVAMLPDTGIFFHFKDANSMQGFGVVCEAMIMALAVVARSRWLQDELTLSIREQKILVENQNKLLEETVQARTLELTQRHRELDEAHHVIVSSVDYASRLQRSQLPKPHRIDGRFKSLGVIWEPRDNIGGDLWWLSSAQPTNPYTLAVADCTGHGVPGAMLSLLVTNALERIYSGDPDKSPAEALMALDFLVRNGLNQDTAESESDDGCDAMIMRIDQEQHQIVFAGAKIGAFQLTPQGQVIRHLATRASLGYCQPPDPENEPIDQVITYTPGDAFVIVTDGFTDQIGGPIEQRSFGYRRIEQVLAQLATNSAQEIVDRLRYEFDEWCGASRIRDDLTVIAFRL